MQYVKRQVSDKQVNRDRCPGSESAVTKMFSVSMQIPIIADCEMGIFFKL